MDHDYESKREIIRLMDKETGVWEEIWTGDYIFGNDTMTIVEVTI